MTSGRRARHLLAMLALLTGTTLAAACGFEDPKGGDAARGAINWVYPDALYVTSAVWRAQIEGVILRDERPEAARALLGYRRATADLAKLRDRLALAMDGEAVPNVSVLLIGPMLWTRFASAQDGLSMVAHIDGAQASDVVIVTDEPVVAALASGQIAPLAARVMGLLRIYGSIDDRTSMANWLDRLPAPMTARTEMTQSEAKHRVLP